MHYHDNAMPVAVVFPGGISPDLYFWNLFETEKDI